MPNQLTHEQQIKLQGASMDIKFQNPTLRGNKVDVWASNQSMVAFEKFEKPDARLRSVSTKWWQKIGNSVCSVFRATSSLSLEEAQAEYEAKRMRQQDELKEVIEKKVEKTPWIFSLLSLLGSVLGLAVVSFSFVLWKRENVYTNQDKW